MPHYLNDGLDKFRNSYGWDHMYIEATSDNDIQLTPTREEVNQWLAAGAVT